jgi:hypothetical protein
MIEDMRIYLDRCKPVKADEKMKWEIMRCPGSNGGMYYVVSAFEEWNVAEAFVKAKEEGLLKDLTTLWWKECDDWAAVVAMYDVSVAIYISDYTRVECITRFMEIVKEIMKKLNEVRK